MVNLDGRGSIIRAASDQNVLSLSQAAACMRELQGLISAHVASHGGGVTYGPPQPPPVHAAPALGAPAPGQVHASVGVSQGDVAMAPGASAKSCSVKMNRVASSAESARLVLHPCGVLLRRISATRR